MRLKDQFKYLKTICLFSKITCNQIGFFCLSKIAPSHNSWDEESSGHQGQYGQIIMVVQVPFERKGLTVANFLSSISLLIHFFSDWQERVLLTLMSKKDTKFHPAKGCKWTLLVTRTHCAAWIIKRNDIMRSMTFG